jgi:antitoxin component of RelBE/YafQ-DinJ toxin-antitoxin module
MNSSLLTKALSTKRTSLTELYQFRMSNEMKTKIFVILEKKDLDLSHLLREFLQSVIDEEESKS